MNDNQMLINAFKQFKDATQNLVQELEKSNYPANEEYHFNQSFDEIASELYLWVETNLKILLENKNENSEKINCCVSKLVKCEYCDKDHNCLHPDGEKCAGHVGF